MLHTHTNPQQKASRRVLNKIPVYLNLHPLSLPAELPRCEPEGPSEKLQKNAVLLFFLKRKKKVQTINKAKIFLL